VEIFAVHGSPDEAQAQSVLFTPPTRADGAPLGAADDADLEARITFGVHGVSSEVFLDVLRGGRIALVASFLRVEVRATGGPFIPAGTAFRVGAMAGYAAAGSTQGQRTLQTFALGVDGGPAVDADFPIPPYSKGVTCLVTPVTPLGGYSLSMLDAGLAVLGSMDFPVGIAAFGTGPGPEQPSASVQNGPRAGMPIPSRARFVRFSNPALASGRLVVALIFEVQL